MKSLALILLLIPLTTLPAAAAGGGAAAPAQVTVRGRVVDEDGDPLPGANVTATNRQTGEVRGGVADDDGYFTLSEIRPGPHRVKVEFDGIIREFDVGDIQAGPEAYRVPVGDKKPPKKPRPIRAKTPGETEIVSAGARDGRAVVEATASSASGPASHPIRSQQAAGGGSGQAMPGTRCTRIPVGSKKRKKNLLRRLF